MAMTTEPKTVDEQAREAVRRGKLPSRDPDSTWGGPGVGAACAVCELPVAKDQLEIEIEFARDGSQADPDRYHVHTRCFTAWQFERKRASQ
jgi:hypothetical protein